MEVYRVSLIVKQYLWYSSLNADVVVHTASAGRNVSNDRQRHVVNSSPPDGGGRTA
jgi:hypothetical protein